VPRNRVVGVLSAALLVMSPAVLVQTNARAQDGDVLVSNGSPSAPFSANKQNEPAVAIDAHDPAVMAAGSNDEIDMEACNAGTDNTCPFTPGVGVSGIYFSTDAGHSWVQPTYQGLTGRGCVGAPGDADPPCTASTGPIGTLPNYAEHNLVSDGDPALAFGPAPGDHGSFSWDNGSRLYYANLTSAVPGASPAPFKGFEAIAVSHTDDLAGAAAGDEGAWSDPVIASQQNGALFSDKEQIWADNAESSDFFGNAYVCYGGFRSAGHGAIAQPLFVLTSRDGGDSWVQKQVTPATDNVNSKNGFGRSGCTIRTDSHGVVYVFVNQFASGSPGAGSILLIKSFDGGTSWTRPRTLLSAFDSCNAVEASIGRCIEDGVGGARSDLSSAPSVDIANGAPTGSDATDRVVLTWVDGRNGLNHEDVRFTWSDDGFQTWAPVRTHVQTGATDRGYYSAPAISPNGTDVWLVYNAWTAVFKDSAEGPDNDRPLVGVVLHADSTAGGVGPLTEVHRGVSGDGRGSSQNNLAAEFLGDYVYAAASRDFGTAVWNDVRNAADCPEMDAYRQELHEEATASGVQTAEAEEPRGEELRLHGVPKADREEGVAPAVQADCDPTFGNSDIYGITLSNP
jgi:hypothetical protein